MYLVIVPHRWEANLQEKSDLKELMFGRVIKFFRLISCATYFF